MKFLTICALVATSNAANVADLGVFVNLVDVCASATTHVPCKGTDNKYYCVLKAKVKSDTIAGGISVHADYPTGTTCATAMDG